MPSEMLVLLFDRSLEHSIATISAATSATFRFGGVKKRAPAACCGNQVHLAVERPIFPVLAHSISQNHLRDVAVSAIVPTVGPRLQNFHVQHLHVEALRVVTDPGRAADEPLPPPPRPR